MTDEEVIGLFPALREFVDAVDVQDGDVVQACLAHTPAATLAVLAAGWAADLMRERDEARARLEVAEEVAGQLSARYVDMKHRRDDLRDILHGRDMKQRLKAA